LKLHGNQQEIGVSEGREETGNEDSRHRTYSPLADQAQAVRLSYTLQFKSRYISLQNLLVITQQHEAYRH